MMNVMDNTINEVDFVDDVNEVVAVYGRYIAYCHIASNCDNAVELKNIAYGKVKQYAIEDFPQYNTEYFMALVRRVYNMQVLTKSMEKFSPRSDFYMQLNGLFDEEFARAVVHAESLGYDKTVVEVLY